MELCKKQCVKLNTCRVSKIFSYVARDNRWRICFVKFDLWTQLSLFMNIFHKTIRETKWARANLEVWFLTSVFLCCAKTKIPWLFAFSFISLLPPLSHYFIKNDRKFLTNPPPTPLLSPIALPVTAGNNFEIFRTFQIKVDKISKLPHHTEGFHNCLKNRS